MSNDIHRQTAAEMFGVPPEEVTPEQRRAARAVNFGLLYGKARQAPKNPTPEHPAKRDGEGA